MGMVTTRTEIQALIDCGPIKAWSVIVTVLGDLCRTPQDRISGRLLNELMGAMGISEQTVRVALHRLRRDNWIQSQKRGRGADYALSPMGWRESRKVWDKVYARTAPAQRNVFLIMAPPDMSAADFISILPDGAVQLGRRMALTDQPLTDPGDILITAVAPGTLPGWVGEAVASEVLRDDYTRLHKAAANIALIARSDDTALRLLTLHHWRRLRLRHSDLPDLLLGPDWPGAQARHAVMAVLDAVPRVVD